MTSAAPRLGFLIYWPGFTYFNAAQLIDGYNIKGLKGYFGENDFLLHLY
jgi:hypothetical protein